MRVFLIIVAVLVVITVLILSLSAELTVIFDKGWTTRVRVLFIEKDVELSKILSFLLFPEKTAEQVAKDKKSEKNKKEESKEKEVTKEVKKEPAPVDDKKSEPEAEKSEVTQPEQVTEVPEDKSAPAKSNPIKKLLDKDGVLGIMLLLSNLLQTAGSAVSTLIKGLHIYSLYVKIIVGGGDAADIGNMYGDICGIYYPLKGMVLNGMRVDMYDDYIMPDFIAPFSEYEFQFIGSINVGLLLKVGLNAAKVFIINLIKNK